MTDRQQAIFFFLIVFFFTCGAGLLVYRQYNAYYEEKTANDLQAAVNLPVQKTSAPVVLADGRLQVNSPKEGGTISQTFAVTGYAQGWFEATIAVKVFDDKNNLLYSGSAMASQDNYSQPSPFSGQVILTATSTTPAGRIEFNDYSAKDGSLVYQKIVNIKFADVGTTGWKSYKNNQYGFEFQYPDNWLVKDDGKSISVFFPNFRQDRPEGGRGIDFTLRGISLQSFIDEYNNSDIWNGQKLADIYKNENYLLDNKAARKLTGTTAIGLDSYHIFIEKYQGSQSLIIGFDDTDKIHKDILSTFKFTK